MSNGKKESEEGSGTPNFTFQDEENEEPEKSLNGPVNGQDNSLNDLMEGDLVPETVFKKNGTIVESGKKSKVITEPLPVIS
jgi:hypothetical protein